jgi:hypothetical protein
VNRAENHDESFFILGVPDFCFSIGGGAGALAVDDIEKCCIAKSYCPAVPSLCVVVFNYDEVKGSFFLTTLPDTMDHIVDNLSARDLTSFTAIEPKLFDLAEKHTLDVDSSAKTAIGAGKKVGIMLSEVKNGFTKSEDLVKPYRNSYGTHTPLAQFLGVYDMPVMVTAYAATHSQQNGN